MVWKAGKQAGNDIRFVATVTVWALASVAPIAVLEYMGPRASAAGASRVLLHLLAPVWYMVCLSIWNFWARKKALKRQIASVLRSVEIEALVREFRSVQMVYFWIAIGITALCVVVCGAILTAGLVERSSRVAAIALFPGALAGFAVAVGIYIKVVTAPDKA